MPKHERRSRWSANVTARWDALDLEPKVFEKKTAGEIAASLKRCRVQRSSEKQRFPIGGVDVDFPTSIARDETCLPNGSTPSKRRKENCANYSDAVSETSCGYGSPTDLNRAPAR